MSVVVVGKNGFLGHALQEEAGDLWTYLSHREALESPEILRNADVVINCAFDADLMSGPYDAAKDIDLKLANIIKDSKAHYIMLSTRMVYGDIAFPFKESDQCHPKNFYGQAKLYIEQNLSQVLSPEKLTILRLSNIFGFEPERKRFFGIALKSLRERKEIVLDIPADSVRDFLSVWRFAKIVKQIATAPKPGIYNIGAGFPVTCGEIANWLIEGYGQGKLVVTGDMRKEDFWLDMSKAYQSYSIEKLSRENLAEDCKSCGAQLAG